MKTKSFTISNIEELHSQFKKAVNGEFRPSLAFVFATPRMGIQDISKALAPYDMDIMGSSSGGNILVNKTAKTIFEDSAVITLVEINRDFYDHICIERTGSSSFSFGKKIGRRGLKKFKKPSFILLASGLSLNGQELVEGICASAGSDTVMFGGLAGDETKFEQNFVFTGDHVYENGCIALAMDTEHVDMQGVATSGWVGLGKDLTITSARSNVVYSIDHEPALRVYKKYLNVRDEDLPAIGVEYPLLIKRGKGEFSLRAVMGVDRKQEALIFAGSVPQDATVTFSSSPGFEVIDRTREEIDAFYQEHPEAEMMLLFSCMARHLALGPMISEEIVFAASKWNLPLSGFFTYGEIGTNPGKSCDFFNQTYTLVILKEKS